MTNKELVTEVMMARGVDLVTIEKVTKETSILAPGIAHDQVPPEIIEELKKYLNSIFDRIEADPIAMLAFKIRQSRNQKRAACN